MEPSACGTGALALAARACSITALVLTVVYAAHASASLAATSADMAVYGGLARCFACNTGWNWHVVLEMAAFVVAMTESILAFRAPLVSRPATYKWVHAFWQTVCLVCAMVGLAAIIKAKLFTGAYHMYSVHAWTGAAVLAALAAQYAVGAAVFALPAVRDAKAKAAVGQWHTLLGKLTFFGGIGAAVTGWADIQMMNVDFGQLNYGSATMLGSVSAMLCWAVAACVAGLVLAHAPRPRGPQPADELNGAAEPAAKGAAVDV